MKELIESGTGKLGLVGSILGTLLVAGILWLITSANSTISEMKLVNYRLSEVEKKIDKVDLQSVNQRIDELSRKFEEYKDKHP